MWRLTHLGACPRSVRRESSILHSIKRKESENVINMSKTPQSEAVEKCWHMQACEAAPCPVSVRKRICAKVSCHLQASSVGGSEEAQILWPAGREGRRNQAALSAEAAGNLLILTGYHLKSPSCLNEHNRSTKNRYSCCEHVREVRNL